jgi:two-component system LytT family sensor kinase
MGKSDKAGIMMTIESQIKGMTGRTERKTIFIHIIIWIIVFLLPYILNSSYNEASGEAKEGEGRFIYLDTITNIFWVILFYLNVLWLVPRLLYPRKFILYGLSLVLSFCLIMLVHGVFFNLIMEGRSFNFFRSSYHNILAFLFTVTISTTYKVMSDKARADAISSEKQKENLKTELSFLRSQVSPHFLFNVLNNIVAMVRLKSAELEPTVMKLSSLLQYMLYENDDEKVLLKNEMEYLVSYIDLQKQRFSSKLKVVSDFDVDDEFQSIEPMLLIPFVENAFKHGNGLMSEPEIIIRLKLHKGVLDFSVRNRFFANDGSKEKSSGIGLGNVQRRLELLYPGRHDLLIHKDDDWFNIHLTIKFSGA